MKIRHKANMYIDDKFISDVESEEVLNVFAMYNVESISTKKMETYFLVLPRNYGALMVRRLNEVDIIEDSFTSEMIFFANRSVGLYHWALIKENLLDPLIDHDEAAYIRFLEIIKAEGVVDQDFY